MMMTNKNKNVNNSVYFFYFKPKQEHVQIKIIAQIPVSHAINEHVLKSKKAVY